MRLIRAMMVLGLGLGLGVGAPIANSDTPPTPIRDAPAEFQAMKNKFTSEKDLKKGKRLYDGKCADCHGEDGTPAEDEPSFKDKKLMDKRSDGQLFYIIKFGNGDDAEMEAWGPESDAALSDQKIWQIVAHIRTLAK